MAGIVNGELKVKKDWEKKKIDDCFVQIINGANIKQVKDGNGIPITRIETISNDVFNRDRMGYANISDAKNYEKYILQDNTILMSHINSMKFLGRSVLYEKMNDEIIIHGMNLLNLIPASFIQPKYACLYFQTSKFRNDIKSISHQSVNQASFNITSLKSISIPVPPLEEQKRIVKILDEKFAQLETIKANAQTNLQNAKDLFQSQLTRAFSNTTWEKKKVSEISENLDSKRIPITKNVRKTGQYPYYGASGIVDYVEDYIFDGKFLLVSEDGANLLARTYPIAFIAEGKFWVNNHAHILSFKDEITMKFVELFFSNLDISPYVTGMAQPKFNQASLNNIEVPLPPLPEQKRIVKELDTLSEKVRQLQEIYTKQIANCDELKQAYLQKAFEGEL